MTTIQPDTINSIIAIACGSTGLALFVVLAYRHVRPAAIAAWFRRAPGLAADGAGLLVGGALTLIVGLLYALVALGFLALLIKGAYLFVMFAINL